MEGVLISEFVLIREVPLDVYTLYTHLAELEFGNI